MDYLVVVGNQASEGGGIYIWGGVSQFINGTISDNPCGDGIGVMIDKYPSSPAVLAQVELTNTIVSSQTVGISATPANTLTMNSVLWHNTPTPIQAQGANLTVQNEHTGDPNFKSDGYHLDESSAAVGLGVLGGVEHDVVLNQLETPICHISRFVVGYKVNQTHLPLVWR